MTDRPPNQFGPLTPEQQAALERDRINESLGPFDWAPGFGTAIGAGAGALGLASIAKDFPWMIRQYGSYAAPHIAKYTAAMMGIPSSMGYAFDVRRQALERHEKEKQLMFDGQSEKKNNENDPANRIVQQLMK